MYIYIHMHECIHIYIYVYLLVSIYICNDRYFYCDRALQLDASPKKSPRPRSSVALGPRAEAADFAPDSDNGEERSNILLGNQ